MLGSSSLAVVLADTSHKIYFTLRMFWRININVSASKYGVRVTYLNVFHTSITLFNLSLLQYLTLSNTQASVIKVQHQPYFSLQASDCHNLKAHSFTHDDEVGHVSLATRSLVRNPANEDSSVDVLVIGAGPTGLGAGKRLHQLVRPPLQQ